ncbi:pre-mRNA cleavage complex 2 protein Pcf11 isoform X2 [Eurosta solidaginis]
MDVSTVKTQDENEARVAEEYLSSLSDLTCNSKPLINMLTMLAEENIAFASVIVKVVEQHISKVPPDIKLPLLYLIDSIVKNVKSTYIQLFSQCIVNIFCDVFEKVNEKIRERMYALRLTWNEVFPTQKLYALDVKVKRIDNNWPITAKQTQPSIHVNPNFLKSVGNVQASDVEEILQAKTRELLELKKRKLELELEATKKSLEEQDKQLSKVTNGLMPPETSTAMSGLRVPPQIMPPGIIGPPGMMPQHPMHQRPPHAMIAASGGGVPSAALFHPNFHHPRPQQQPQHAQIGMMPMPSQNFPPSSSSNKPKVHPVNPALLSTIRHRDPRLARQQQMQEPSVSSMRSSPKSSSSSMRGGDESQKSASSSKTSSSASYRNGSSSKSSRHDGGGGSGSESSRHSSYSNSDRHRKSSSRDKNKDKDHKRSESKSSTSSGGSCSSERHKSSSLRLSAALLSPSSRSSKKSTSASKCDKDAFEIAPLSTAFKTKSSSTSIPGSSSSSAPSSSKKELKRQALATHSTSSPTATRNRSRSRSPPPSVSSKSTVAASTVIATTTISASGNSIGVGVLTDQDERLAVPIFSPKKQTKSNTVDAEREELDLENADNKSADIKIENKTPPQPALEGDNSDHNDDDDGDKKMSETTVTTTTETRTSTTTITTKATATSIPTEESKPINAGTSVETENIKNDNDSGGGGGGDGDVSGDGVGVETAAAPIVAESKNDTSVVAVSSSVSVKRHSSTDSTPEQRSVKPKAPLSPTAKFEAMDVDDSKEEKKLASEDKKRLSTSTTDLEEPLAKKSKSAKFDALFGDEDVDLRTGIPPQILAAQQQQLQTNRDGSKSPTPPPPPFIRDDENAESWNNLKTSKAPKSSNISKKSSNLDDVRAKLAKATKYSKFNKPEKSNKDMTQRLKLSDAQLNDDSQDANDEKIRTIVAQAQELLENKSINQDQYKNLMQKVMSINETSKLKEAKKRESLGSSAGSSGSVTHSKRKNLEDNEEIDEQELRGAAVREAVLKKRIPKLMRHSSKDSKSAADSTTTRSPIYDERSNDNTDMMPNVSSTTTRAKPQREKRQKPSKWGDKVIVDGATAVAAIANAAQPKPWQMGAGNMLRPHHSVGGVGGFHGAPPPPLMPAMPPQLPWQIQMPPVMPPGAPFVNPAQMIRSSVPPPPPAPPVMPIIPLAPSLPKPCNSIDNPQADLVRTITIDGLSKEIRIYDQVAIVFMELDQPREIGFQAGQRSIIIDDEAPILLKFNDDYKAFSINGQLHRLRFGFPSRELYIDEHWYEIYFGGPPVSIPIQNRMHILKAEGPPPQVNIGALRRDLVVGKINMIVDAHIVIPLFLDAKPQSFKLGNQNHTVQFADNLLTVLLDGEPAKVEYGGLPKSYVLGGVSYFIRFGALPQGLKAGQIIIKNMVYVKAEPPAVEPIVPAVLPTKKEEPLKNVLPSDIKKDEVVDDKTIEDNATADVKVEEKSDANPTDVKLEIVIKTPEGNSGEQVAGEPQVVGTAISGDSAIPIFSATALNKINIDELFQKLVSSGILGGGGSGNGGSGATGAGANTVAVSSNKDAGILPSALAIEEEPPQPIAVRPIDLAKPETVKTRQTAIVYTLFSGMQCSSCGVRFPPEQTIKYSQHLDWHFRQNRRERDLSRKAHSRKWYYDLADWVQYEEIEDLEEREKNFFETQQTDIDACDDTSNQKWLNSPASLSCPALPDDVDRACDMCHEKFDQFYNEETEDWHLRNATRVEDKIYHPLCYEDYKASLLSKEQEKDEKEKVEAPEDETNTDDVVIIKIEGDEHSNGNPMETSTIIMEDDDDDVIVLPNEEPSVTEIEDDDESEVVPQNVEKETIDIDKEDNEEKATDADAAGSDVEIQEPNIPFTDLDGYEEKEQPGTDETTQMSFKNIKIKEEPKDDDDEDDGFEDVGTVLVPADEEISIQSSEETQTQTITSSTSRMSPTTERPPSSQSIVQVDSTEFAENSATNTATATTSIDLNASIDGNTVTEDEHNLSTVGPAPAIPLASLVNKIKINIAKSSSSSNNNNNNNNNNSNTMGNSSPSRLGDSNDNTNGDTTTTPLYSNISAISVVSTIPVLCGGGTTAVRTTTVVNEESNVSTISVIGSYGNSSTTPRYFPPSTSSSHNTLASTMSSTAKRQRPPTTTTPPLPPSQPAPKPQEEETMTYELKPALKNAKLTKTKKLQCGVETSGLCSIM